MSSGIFIGLGANLGDPPAQLQDALAALERDGTIAVLRASRAYRTPAWGNTEQPEFVNAAAELASALEPQALVAALLAVERECGRERDVRWAPRTLDLDLLLYGARVLDVPGCRVPHPHLHERAFALVPLLELAPDAVIPGRGPAAACLARLSSAERDAIVQLDLPSALFRR